MKLLIPIISLSLILGINTHASPSQAPLPPQIPQTNKNQPKVISNDKAIRLAIKAVKKHRLFGGAIPQYSETQVRQIGQIIRVSFLRDLPRQAVGGRVMYSVDLDATTGKLVQFLPH
jgi:hypothetical protein